MTQKQTVALAALLVVVGLLIAPVIFEGCGREAAGGGSCGLSGEVCNSDGSVEEL